MSSVEYFLSGNSVVLNIIISPLFTPRTKIKETDQLHLRLN